MIDIIYKDSENTLIIIYDNCPYEIEGFVLFGSKSSNDYDIIFFVPDSLKEKICLSQGISTKICKMLERYCYEYISKLVSSNIPLIKDKPFDPSNRPRDSEQ